MCESRGGGTGGRRGSSQSRPLLRLVSCVWGNVAVIYTVVRRDWLLRPSSLVYAPAVQGAWSCYYLIYKYLPTAVDPTQLYVGLGLSIPNVRSSSQLSPPRPAP